MAQANLTIETIVNRMKQEGNRDEAFRLLFERCYNQVYRFFCRRSFSPDESRDLTQDTFLHVYRGVSQLQQESKFESWLYGIALNIYRSEITRRQAKKRDATEVSFDEEFVPGDGTGHAAARAARQKNDPLEAVLDKEKKEALRDALEELPPQMRRCIAMLIVNEMSYQEIAGSLGLSVNTVKSHLAQARKILNAKLRRHFGEVEV